MLDKLGITGILGLLIMVAGVAVVAWQDPIIAAGFALVLLGIGLLLRAAVNSLMGAMGMGGMF